MDKPDRQTPALAVCGWSGSGKTTLLEQIVPLLCEKGLSVAVVKHDAHQATIDTPGTDSDRLFRAGADIVLRSTDEILHRGRPDEHSELEPLLERLSCRHDVVLVEGHKSTPLPKIWVLAENESAAPAEIDGVLDTLTWNQDRVSTTLGIVDSWINQQFCSRPVFGGILLGGQSSRLGSPKQLVELHGRTFVEHVASALEPYTDAIVLLGDGPVPDTLTDQPRLPDPPNLHGPMAGVLAALRWSIHATWVVAPCDQPQLTTESIKWLVEQRSPGIWAVMPQLRAALQPFPGVFEPQSRSLFETLAAKRRFGPVHIAAHHRVHTPEPPSTIADCWHDVDTPDDLYRLRNSVSDPD